MRICVYTAIFGSYDTLLQPVAQTVPTDFICFTDAKRPSRVGAWRVIRSRARPRLHPRLRAKFFKVMSHSVFPEGHLAARYGLFSARPRYDALLWVDGCLRITAPDFAESFARCIGPNGLAMYAHPDRDCIYDECRECLTLPRLRGSAGAASGGRVSPGGPSAACRVDGQYADGARSGGS